MFTRRKITIILFFAFLAVVAGTFVKRYLIAPELKLEEIEVQNFLGEKSTLETLKGKVVVLNFWATWCQPCVKEMPIFDEMFKKMEGKDVEILMVSDEGNGRLISFIKKHALTVPVYQLTKDMKAYGVYTIPSTFIFDKTGKLVEKKLGIFESEDELQNLIHQYSQ